MNFKINSKDLFIKLQYCGRVVGSKNHIPILDCFKFSVRGERLYIVAADTEMRISTDITVFEVERDGNVAINTKTLLDSLRMLPEQVIEIDVNPNTNEIIIIYNNGRYCFIGSDAQDYPKHKEMNTDYHTLSIHSEDLLLGIEGCIFASADDELRPVMCGVNIDVDRDETIFVASDGHKLVKLTAKEATGSDKASFILPKKPANIIRPLLNRLDEDIIVKFDTTHALVSIGDYNITCRFIEGRYPNYDAVIPTNNSNKVELNRESFLAMLKRVSVYANKESNLVRISFADHTMTLTAQDLDFSTSAQEEANIHYLAAPMTIGFKSTFLIEVLESIQSESIQLLLSEASRAALILPVENKEEWNCTCLLMPMMLNE